MNENMKMILSLKQPLYCYIHIVDICINGQTRLVARSWKFVEHLTNI